MARVVLLGTGNVARHLFDAFYGQDGIEIVQVAGRNQKALSYFSERSETTSNLNEICTADIYILAVSDNAIGKMAHEINTRNGILVHTSGSTPMDRLPNLNRRGVFYPLQTFSHQLEVNFEEVPICLEAENKEDYIILEKLARTISNQIYRVNSQQRLQLHIAAVFVNNFVNHLFHIGQSIIAEQELSFELLKPLMRETVRKIEHIVPFEAQTGPARRQDKETMDFQLKHIDSLNYRAIYSAISNSIQATYGEKL